MLINKVLLNRSHIKSTTNWYNAIVEVYFTKRGVILEVGLEAEEVGSVVSTLIGKTIRVDTQTARTKNIEEEDKDENVYVSCMMFTNCYSF